MCACVHIRTRIKCTLYTYGIYKGVHCMCIVCVSAHVCSLVSKNTNKISAPRRRRRRRLDSCGGVCSELPTTSAPGRMCARTARIMQPPTRVGSIRNGYYVYWLQTFCTTRTHAIGCRNSTPAPPPEQQLSTARRGAAIRQRMQRANARIVHSVLVVPARPGHLRRNLVNALTAAVERIQPAPITPVAAQV